MKRYHFVWLAGDEKHTKDYYESIIENKNIDFLYKNKISENRIINFVFWIMFSNTVNHYMKVPLKSIWYKYIYNLIQKNAKENIIIIFTEGWYDKGFLKWLQLNYPKTKKILYLVDTIEFYLKNKTLMIPDNLNQELDIVFSYNPLDVEKYGFKKTNAYLSAKKSVDICGIQKTDLSFIGKAKDRYELLLQIYDHLKDKCRLDFIVVMLRQEDQRIDGIHYSDTNISYEEYLKHEIASNCIMEIIKGDSAGETLRCWEAVYYNKKLLTNWKGIFEFQYYDARYMRYFERVEDIDIGFILDDQKVDYHYNGENSPERFLELLEKEFQQGE